MKSVNIAEFKNRLSVYLNDVKASEEILVRDRNQPVAKIVTLARRRRRVAGACLTGEATLYACRGPLSNRRFWDYAFDTP